MGRSTSENPSGLLVFHPIGDPPRMRFYALRPGSVAEIGRSEACRVPLQDSEASREHARLEHQEGRWTVTDCGSTNGVFVNGRRAQTARLRGGEVLRIGGSLLRFLARGSAATDCEHAVAEDGFVGGPSVAEIRRTLLQAADSDLTVLLGGRTGTGKEVAARFLHQASARRHGPFVPVNCAAIPTELFESELFGHVKGAFSGAIDDAQGLVRAAHGGTLFLDEVGDLSAPCQAKLLRVLQDGAVRPVGSARSTQVNIRVLCATNSDLQARMRAGGFREDLYSRLAELALRMPALERRVEDIPLLARHFTRKHDGQGRTLPLATLELLCCARWERNVRQLENAIRRALLAAGDVLEPGHFTELDRGPRSLENAPSAPLEDVLRRCDGDVNRAAAELGISRSQLYRRAQKLGLRPANYRPRRPAS